MVHRERGAAAARRIGGELRAEMRTGGESAEKWPIDLHSPRANSAANTRPPQVDLNPSLSAAQRVFTSEVKRCAEMQRSLAFLEEELAAVLPEAPDAAAAAVLAQRAAAEFLGHGAVVHLAPFAVDQRPVRLLGGGPVAVGTRPRIRRLDGLFLRRERDAKHAIERRCSLVGVAAPRHRADGRHGEKRSTRGRGKKAAHHDDLAPGGKRAPEHDT